MERIRCTLKCLVYFTLFTYLKYPVKFSHYLHYAHKAITRWSRDQDPSLWHWNSLLFIHCLSTSFLWYLEEAANHSWSQMGLMLRYKEYKDCTSLRNVRLPSSSQWASFSALFFQMQPNTAQQRIQLWQLANCNNNTLYQHSTFPSSQSWTQPTLIKLHSILTLTVSTVPILERDKLRW